MRMCREASTRSCNMLQYFPVKMIVQPPTWLRVNLGRAYICLEEVIRREQERLDSVDHLLDLDAHGSTVSQFRLQLVKLQIHNPTSQPTSSKNQKQCLKRWDKGGETKDMVKDLHRPKKLLCVNLKCAKSSHRPSPHLDRGVDSPGIRTRVDGPIGHPEYVAAALRAK